MSRKNITRVSNYLSYSIQPLVKRRWRGWLAGLVVLTATILPATLLASTHYGISVFDEGVHFDYIYKVTQGDVLPRPAQVISDETLQEVRCRPSVVYPDTSCNNSLSVQDLPVGGVNYVLGYAGVYYIPAAAIAILLHATDNVSWFMAARFASVLLFGISALVLYVVCRRYGASRIASAGVTVVLATCLTPLTQGATVNPESIALLAGALAALPPTLNLSWRKRLITAIIIGTAIALVKPNFVPLGCITILLAGIMPKNNLRLFTLRDIVLQRRFFISMTLALIPLLAQILWNWIGNMRLEPGMRADGYLNDMLYYDGPLFNLVTKSLSGMLSPLKSGALLSSEVLGLVGALVAICIAGGAFMIASSPIYNSSPRVKIIAILGLIGLIGTAVYVPVVLYLAYHSEGAQSRYIVPVYAFLAIAVAASVEGRVSRWIPLAIGLVSVIYIIARLTLIS